MQSENFIPKIRVSLSTSTCAASFPKTFREWPSGALSRYYASPIRIRNSLANSQPIQSPPRIRSQKEEDSQHAIHGGHPLILYNLYAREPRAFSDISKETRPTRFPLSPHTSRTVSAVVLCVYLLKPASAGPLPVFIRVHFALLSYLSHILCIASCNGVQRAFPCDE